MPYQKKVWCPHPSHIGLTRSGQKPLHPVGLRIIDEREAKLFNTHIMSNSQWTSVFIKAGDKVCQTCVIDIRESEKEVIAQCYEPSVSLSSYIRCFNQVKNNMKIPCNNVIASFIHPPVFGRRNQLSLSQEQFIDIQKFCT